MNHLPLEVLHEIFIKLDLEVKLKCLYVCRRWYDVLDRRSLLHSIFITTGEFPNWKEMIACQPHRATQVEYVEIMPWPSSSPEYDYRILCNMFPNMRDIILEKKLIR